MNGRMIAGLGAAVVMVWTGAAAAQDGVSIAPNVLQRVSQNTPGSAGPSGIEPAGEPAGDAAAGGAPASAPSGRRHSSRRQSEAFDTVSPDSEPHGKLPKTGGDPLTFGAVGAVVLTAGLSLRRRKQA